MKPIVKTLLSTFILIACYCVQAQSDRNIEGLAGFDIFGTQQLSLDDIDNSTMNKLRLLVKVNTDNQYEEFLKLKKEIQDDLHKKGNFSYIELSFITYFKPNPGRYLTIDFVDTKDKEARMPFFKKPTGSYSDPGGSLSLWEEYMNTAWKLIKSGDFEYQKSCPVFHCTFGFEDLRLKKYGKQFDELAKLYEKELFVILEKDINPQHRANAAFLLAHTGDGEKLINKLKNSVFDPEKVVRNNVIRVLSGMSTNHKQFDYPLNEILTALNFPSTTDRNKASAVLVELSLKDNNKKLIAQKVGGIIIRMLKLKQPNNHDFAYQILKNLSGKDYGSRNYKKWEEWLKVYTSSKN